VSIRHDLYFVCKAASVRSDLLQALYKLVIINYCKVASVQLVCLTITDISYHLILIKICTVASVPLDLIQILIRISYRYCVSNLLFSIISPIARSRLKIPRSSFVDLSSVDCFYAKI
jgi:hypothetical protein